MRVRAGRRVGAAVVDVIGDTDDVSTMCVGLVRTQRTFSTSELLLCRHWFSCVGSDGGALMFSPSSIRSCTSDMRMPAFCWR